MLIVHCVFHKTILDFYISTEMAWLHFTSEQQIIINIMLCFVPHRNYAKIIKIKVKIYTLSLCYIRQNIIQRQSKRSEGWTNLM